MIETLGESSTPLDQQPDERTQIIAQCEAMAQELGMTESMLSGIVKRKYLINGGVRNTCLNLEELGEIKELLTIKVMRARFEAAQGV